MQYNFNSPMTFGDAAELAAAAARFAAQAAKQGKDVAISTDGNKVIVTTK